MGRINSRPGFGALRGASNPKRITGQAPPTSPVKNDEWINEITGAEWWYNGTTWLLKSVIDQRTGERRLIWTGTESGYAALTPEDSTLYFCVAD